MYNSFIIRNALIVNEGKLFMGSVTVMNGMIAGIQKGITLLKNITPGLQIIDAGGKLLIPGVIDDQVHFREPGLTHKGDIGSESLAAVAGGITSFMEMPNTNPLALTQDLLEEKYTIASIKSPANYSFYMGTANDNSDEVLRTDPKTVCGVKIFMGASTGNMLVDNLNTLREIFSRCKLLIATHCEDEVTIRINTAAYREKYGEQVPISMHPLIRSREACYKSTQLAVNLARQYGTRLHVLHLSTADEMEFFDNSKPLAEKMITAEVCVHHLWFDEKDYSTLGNKIKWNPAIKSATDRQALFQALLDNRLDVVATDHAPHTLEEKNNTYFKSPSGGPLVQHALPAMLEFFHQGKINLEKIVEKMCHAPAICFRVKNRGFIRPGYFADLVLVDLNSPQMVQKENLLYKCGWSPFEGQIFHSRITHTFVNGNLVYENGNFFENKGMRLEFDR
ncbi:MAG: dihydroorotase [Bacteroidales bacterium]|nr:dihydroorotase [Bacteroidales bacterium]MDZ4204549.1 dihydroorotase [Bacteroidales bacterium]